MGECLSPRRQNLLTRQMPSFSAQPLTATVRFPNRSQNIYKLANAARWGWSCGLHLSNGDCDIRMDKVFPFEQQRRRKAFCKRIGGAVS